MTCDAPCFEQIRPANEDRDQRGVWREPGARISASPTYSNQKTREEEVKDFSRMVDVSGRRK